MSKTDTKRPARPWGALVGACAIAALLIVWAMQGSLSGAGVPVGRAATIAVGMTLQAIPFLLLGVFVAELIEAFVSPAFIARVFPTNPLASVLTALVAAFALPVCDCSAVPIFRSLLRKGVPLSAATTLMLASPAINPLVIASTLYAFGSWSLVAARVGASVVVALCVGLSMLVAPPTALREEGRPGADHGRDACCCEDGCELPDRSVSGVLAATGRSFGRILPFLLGGRGGLDDGAGGVAGVVATVGTTGGRRVGPHDGGRFRPVPVFVL